MKIDTSRMRIEERWEDPSNPYVEGLGLPQGQVCTVHIEVRHPSSVVRKAVRQAIIARVNQAVVDRGKGD